MLAILLSILLSSPNPETEEVQETFEVQACVDDTVCEDAIDDEALSLVAEAGECDILILQDGVADLECRKLPKSPVCISRGGGYSTCCRLVAEEFIPAGYHGPKAGGFDPYKGYRPMCFVSKSG